MSTIAIVVVCIFVAAFAIILVLALLDLAQIHPIRDPTRRKWLFGILIVSVAGTVLTFGKKVFDNLPVAATGPDSAATDAQKVDKTGAAKETANSDSGASPVIEPPIAASSDASVIATIGSTWASANMPTRPTISAEFESQYPACVASLRVSTTSNSAVGEAAQCRSDLESHKIKYVSSYYSVKVAYDRAIRAKQTDISRSGLVGEEIAIYNFLQQENEDLNYRDGKSWNAIVSAETRINDDIEFCRERQ